MFEFISKAFGDTQDPKWGGIMTTLGIGAVGGVLTAASGGGLGAIIIAAVVSFFGATMLAPVIENVISNISNRANREPPKSTPKADAVKTVNLKVNQPGGEKPVSVSTSAVDMDRLRQGANDIQPSFQIMGARERIELNLPKEEQESALNRVRQSEQAAANFVANIEKLREEGQAFNDKGRPALRDALKASRAASGGTFDEKDIPVAPVKTYEDFLNSLPKLTPELDALARNGYEKEGRKPGDFGKDEDTKTRAGQIIFAYNAINKAADDYKPDWEKMEWYKQRGNNDGHWYSWNSELNNRVIAIRKHLDGGDYATAQNQVQDLRQILRAKPEELSSYQQDLRKEIEADRNASGYIEELYSYTNAKRRGQEIEGLYKDTLDRIHIARDGLVAKASDHAKAMENLETKTIKNANDVLASQQREVAAGGAAADGTSLSVDAKKLAAQEGMALAQKSMRQTSYNPEDGILPAGGTPAKPKEQPKVNPAKKLDNQAGLAGG